MAEETEVAEIDREGTAGPSDRSNGGRQSIQVEGLTKAFGSRRGVTEVSFTIQRGEVVGFLGPNGSGKTTTMRLLTSYYTPDSGSILINGIDNQEHDKETRRSIGYLPENNPLYSDMLVKEYLDFVADLRGLSPSEKRINLESTIVETGISEVYYLPVSQLSKGYRQRTGLAAAILHRPDILIMDEPTEGLDPNQRLTIRDLIRTLGEERTVLLSTHVLGEVENTCDRILMINHGRIIADDSVQHVREQATGTTAIGLEVEGAHVESSLKRLPDVISVEERKAVDGRLRFLVSVSGERDIRSEIFELAKRNDWTLWDLHLESARLEEVFHSLTTGSDPAQEPKSGESEEGE